MIDMIVMLVLFFHTSIANRVCVCCRRVNVSCRHVGEKGEEGEKGKEGEKGGFAKRLKNAPRYNFILCCHQQLIVIMITFVHMPSFDHLSEASRQLAMQQHTRWMELLEQQSDKTLHNAVRRSVGSDALVLRQHISYLVAKHCQQTNVSTETLMHIIQTCGGALSTRNLLMDNPKTGATDVFNLLSLESNVLQALYHQLAPSASVATPYADSFDWVCCDACSKWRRIEVPIDTLQQWICSMHPHAIDCEMEEEQMSHQEVLIK